jgi:hypothetical protein
MTLKFIPIFLVLISPAMAFVAGDFDSFDGRHAEIMMDDGRYFAGTIWCDRFDNAKLPDLDGKVKTVFVIGDNGVAMISPGSVKWVYATSPELEANWEAIAAS